MRTALLANNWVGGQIAQHLANRGELEVLILHPEEKRKRAETFDGLCAPTFTWPDGFDFTADAEVECLLSVSFGYIVPDDWLALPSWAAVNLHPALLPYNRGANPNVWPLIDGSPAGTTLHVMTPKLDGGDILCQRHVPVSPSDTGASLYRRLEIESLAMFTEEWDGLSGLTPRPQRPGGSYHRVADLATLDLTEADMTVIDHLRARTGPPGPLEFERHGARYRVTVNIEQV